MKISRCFAVMLTTWGVALSAQAQTASTDSEAGEYATTQPSRPGKIDFSSVLGVSHETADQVKTILRAARESGTVDREAVRAQLATVLNDEQLGKLHDALQARRAQRPPANSGINAGLANQANAALQGAGFGPRQNGGQTGFGPQAAAGSGTRGPRCAPGQGPNGGQTTTQPEAPSTSQAPAPSSSGLQAQSLASRSGPGFGGRSGFRGR